MSKAKHRTFRYRLYPTKAQAALLTEQLGEACRLYNAAVQERRDAWKIERKSISFVAQSAQLKDIRAAGDIGLPNFDIACSVLRRVDKTFKAFFARVKRKEKAGYPRFKSARRYGSLVYPRGRDCKIAGGRKLRFSGVGNIKIKLHRPLEGKIKTLTVKREAGKWFAYFVAECEPKFLPPCVESVGIDVGLTAFATLSDGTEIPNPRYFQAAQAKLRRAQRKVARRKKGSHRRRKAVQLLQRAHIHVRNQRADFHHKISRWLVNNYGLIAVEDLNIKGLAGGMLAKSVNDAGWGMFLDKIAYKAANAGRQFFRVNPKGTSQTCLCGANVPKTLSQRWHQCSVCGLSAARDHVSAQIILARAVRVQALTSPIAECVA